MAALVSNFACILLASIKPKLIHPNLKNGDKKLTNYSSYSTNKILKLCWRRINVARAMLSQFILKSNPPINQLVWLVNEQPLAKIVLPDFVGGQTSARRISIGTATERATMDNNSMLAEAQFDDLFAKNSQSLLLSTSLQTDEFLSKYRVDGPMLTVMNLTNSDLQDEYKCLAINILGQSSSPAERLDGGQGQHSCEQSEPREALSKRPEIHY